MKVISVASLLLSHYLKQSNSKTQTLVEVTCIIRLLGE